MKKLFNRSVLLVLAGLIGSEGFAQTSSKQIGNGWIALTSQADPFDSSSVDISQIFKGEFTFRCGELNMRADSYGYESLSFSAELKYMIDSGSPQNKAGKYSTYLGGSDLVTDSRYYSFKMTDDDVEAMRTGTAMQVAGKYGSSGWQTKSLELVGFSSAYSEMCN